MNPKNPNVQRSLYIFTTRFHNSVRHVLITAESEAEAIAAYHQRLLADAVANADSLVRLSYDNLSVYDASAENFSLVLGPLQ